MLCVAGSTKAMRLHCQSWSRATYGNACLTQSHASQPDRKNAAPSREPFGLTVAGFADCHDDSFFFPSDQHLRALEFLGHALWTRARLGVITADRGCGKSLVIERLVRSLDERVVCAAVRRKNLSPRDFQIEILRQFGLDITDNDKTDRRRLIEQFLSHQAANGRIVLLIVENPQAMHPSVLEELRALAAVTVDGQYAVKLMLLGQPALNLVLDSPRMTDLVAGCVARFSLSALSEDQTAAYVAHRLRAAGSADPDSLMPHTLMPQIYAVSGGVPAHINLLCERALAHADEEDDARVTMTALERAIDDLGWRDRMQAPSPVMVKSETAELAEAVPAKLIVSMQGTTDREITLEGARILIGRGDEADVRIDSVFVSRYHAFIVRDGGQDLLLDLGSTNGLLVNSRRIVRRVLRHRDLIQVGPARVMYSNEHSMPKAQPDPGETICFARPGFPAAAGDDDAATLLAFGRLDPTGGF
jgi:general secretion pathway protein A